jgi:hypothetical protein
MLALPLIKGRKKRVGGVHDLRSRRLLLWSSDCRRGNQNQHGREDFSRKKSHS